MAEYDLVCDTCGDTLSPEDAVISWRADGESESGFTLTHPAHAPAGATEHLEGRHAITPNGYLRFVGERVGRRIADPAPLRAILWGLAPFVMRPDNAAEMDAMRAASFGERVGVKPGTKPSPLAAGAQEKHEGGK